jgi:AraC-like DNA-binding protein
MLGFEDPLYFSKKFRAYYGVSPSEYRKSGIAE